MDFDFSDYNAMSQSSPDMGYMSLGAFRYIASHLYDPQDHVTAFLLDTKDMDDRTWIAIGPSGFKIIASGEPA